MLSKYVFSKAPSQPVNEHGTFSLLATNETMVGWKWQ
jgi:hypothetical protein